MEPLLSKEIRSSVLPTFFFIAKRSPLGFRPRKSGLSAPNSLFCFAVALQPHAVQQVCQQQRIATEPKQAQKRAAVHGQHPAALIWNELFSFDARDLTDFGPDADLCLFLVAGPAGHGERFYSSSSRYCNSSFTSLVVQFWLCQTGPVYRRMSWQI